MKKQTIRTVATFLVAGCACVALAGPLDQDSQMIGPESTDLVNDLANTLPISATPSHAAAAAPPAIEELGVVGVGDTPSKSSSGQCSKAFSDFVGTGTWPVCYGSPETC